MAGYVVILGSLDTKGEEVAFLRDAVRAQGGLPLVVDTGVLGRPAIAADVSRERVAQAAGTSLSAIVDAGDKAQALLVMADGAARLLGQWLASGELGGVISIGGSRGTALSARAMQSLPVGVPKLMVSTMASGQTPFGPYVGTRDVTLMPSVADILGVNAVTRPLLTNAAAAIVAMSRVGHPVVRSGGGSLAASMLGATTTLVEQIRKRLSDRGEEVVAFHAVGSGGRAMEELIDAGLFRGVLDVTTSELAASLVGSPFSAGPERMRAAGRQGIAQVVAPGGLDFIIEGPPESIVDRYAGRKTMRHTPTITLVRTTPEELEQIAETMAARLAESSGPAAAILPLRGFSWFSLEGQPLHDPVADRAFVRAFRARVPEGIQVVELETHVNDPAVAEAAVELMQALLET